MEYSSLLPDKENLRSVDALPMTETEYLALVDQTGRIARIGKRGRIDPSLAPVFERLGLTANQWIAASTGFRSNYRNGDLRLKRTA